MGSLGGGGFQQHGVGGRGLAFPTGVGSGWQIVAPASLTRRRICQNHWLSLNFFAFFPATVSSSTFVGGLLCNSFGFNWLACPAATELEMGSGGQKMEGFARGRGFQRGRRGLAGRDDDSGRRKKKFGGNHPVRRLDHRFSRSNSNLTIFRSN